LDTVSASQVSSPGTCLAQTTSDDVKRCRRNIDDPLALSYNP